MTKDEFVVIATPSFERRPCIEFIVSMMETKQALSDAKIDHVITLLGGDPYLGKVRNRLVGTVLHEHPKATSLFFIDDDVGWPAAKVLEFVRRPEDVVFGVYPKKQDSLDFPVTLHVKDGKPVEENGLYLAQLAPTGFMRIRRNVLEKMAANSGTYMEALPDGSKVVNWNIFEAKYVDLDLEELRKRDLSELTKAEAVAYLKRAIGLVPSPRLGEFWGEDFWFTERWRQMGGSVWCDPDINFIHRGTKAWGANFWNAALRGVVESGGVKE